MTVVGAQISRQLRLRNTNNTSGEANHVTYVRLRYMYNAHIQHRTSIALTRDTETTNKEATASRRRLTGESVSLPQATGAAQEGFVHRALSTKQRLDQVRA